MAGRSYWLDLFTAVTWQEFLEAGGKVSGFRESRWSTLQKVKPGDYFLCYVTGISNSRLSTAKDRPLSRMIFLRSE